MGQLELVRTQEVYGVICRKPPADILDVGGATGVHAEWLAADGYRVHIVDMTPRHVEKARADLAPLGVTAELGDRAASRPPTTASTPCSCSVRCTTSSNGPTGSAP